MNIIKLSTLSYCLSLTVTACSSQRAFTRGSYEDPNVIEMLSDDFNENDLQLIAKKMVSSLGNSSLNQGHTQPSTLMIGRIENKSDEHIDMESLSDKIKVQLINQGQFSFINKKARSELAEEYQYEQSGYVKEEQAQKPGQQERVDYLLTGRISSIIQEVGRDKLVYYKFTMEVTDVSSGVIRWTDEKELRKKFKKKRIQL